VERRFAALYLILITVSSLATLSVRYPIVHAQSTTAIVGVWSSVYSSNNITVTNGDLGPGTQFTIDINITDAPEFNGYEFALFYDPTNITVVSWDIGPGTTMFNNPLTAGFDNDIVGGAFRISVVNLGNTHFSGSGTLTHITFGVNGLGASPLALAAATPNPSSRAQSPGAKKPDWTLLVVTDPNSGTTSVGSPLTTSDGDFRNTAGPGKLPPVASFTWFPVTPFEMQSVSFDASASFDPDKGSDPGSGIASYRWDFGDGSTGVQGPVLDHTVPYIGNFSVVLTVVDIDTHYKGIKALLLTVSQTPQHRIQISALLLNGNPAPQLNLGERVNIAVTVLNAGTFVEIFNLTISYGPPDKLIPPAYTNEAIKPGTSHTRTFNATLETSQLSYGSHEVTVALTDPNVDPPVKITKGVFTIVEPTSFPYLPIGVGLAVIVAIPTTVLLLRRRRKEDIE